MTMQVLNFLFQPNNTLIYFLYFPLSLLESFIVISFSTTLFNVSTTKKQKLIYIIFACSLSTFCKFIIPIPYTIIFNALVMLLLIKFIFKFNALISMICSIIPFIFIAILESIISAIAVYFTNISINELNTIPIYVIGVPLFIHLVMYVVYLLLKKFNIKTMTLHNFTFDDKSRLILNGILGLTVVYLNLYVIFTYSCHLPNKFTMISILVLIIYFLVTTYCLTNVNKLAVAKQNISNLQLSNKRLTTVNDNISAFKHDFNNIIQSIGGYIETEDLDSLKEYYKDLVKDCYSVTNLETLKPEVINDASIYSVLASKYYKADAKNIQMNIEVCTDLNALNISTYEFTRILGILLDNSIEAAEECEEKIINVKFYDDTNKNRQLVIIENTYSNKEIDTIKIFEKSYTTKENNTGLGLWEVNKILSKHNNLSLFTTKNNAFFIQQLEIYKK